MRKVIVLGVLVLFASLLPSQVLAQSLSVQALKPFQFGPGATAAWSIGPGTPDTTGESQQWGLYLQKGVPTASFAAAGADVVLKAPLPGAASLLNLSFEISGVVGVPFGIANGYCGAGSPRWSVIHSGGTCFLGCNAADKTQDPATGWFKINWTAPFTQYAGCETGLSGQISNLFVILDEGTDQGPGNVVIDNITINNKVFRKP